MIYRDGVGGPSYHEKVSRLEMPLVEEILTSGQIQPNYKPKFTYCLVDKKINTRLVEKIGNEYANPAPGTTVNTGLTQRAPGSHD